MRILLIIICLLLCFTVAHAETCEVDVLSPYVWNGYSWTLAVCHTYQCEFTLTSINHGKTMPPVPNLITAHIVGDCTEIEKVKKDAKYYVSPEDKKKVLPVEDAIKITTITQSSLAITGKTVEEVDTILREKVKEFKAKVTEVEIPR